MLSRGSIQGISLLIFSYELEKIKEECKKLSALYAKDKTDEEGKSIFSTLVITDDEALLMDDALVSVIPIVTSLFMRNGLIRDISIDRDELSGSMQRDRAGYVSTIEGVSTVYWDVVDLSKASDNLANDIEMYIFRLIAYTLVARVYSVTHPEHVDYFAIEVGKITELLESYLFYII